MRDTEQDAGKKIFDLRLKVYISLQSLHKLQIVQYFHWDKDKVLLFTYEMLEKVSEARRKQELEIGLNTRSKTTLEKLLRDMKHWAARELLPLELAEQSGDETGGS